MFHFKHLKSTSSKGYECTKILIATFLRGLKGVKMYKADVALNLKIAFPLFNTMKVCKTKQYNEKLLPVHTQIIPLNILLLHRLQGKV